MAAIENTPWSEPQASTAIAGATAHWRDRLGNEPTSLDELGDLDDRDSAPPAFLLGYLGTAVAGGFFPLAVAIVTVFTSGPPTIKSSAGIVLFSLLLFPIGCLFAATAAFVVFPIAAFVQWVARLHRWTDLVVSCAGGWSGFCSVMVFGHGELDRGGGALEIALLAGGAMAMGHLGAWSFLPGTWSADRRRRGQRPSQFPLRQAFGITTATAVLMAILASLPVGPATHVAITTAAAVQALVILSVVLYESRGACDSSRDVAGGNLPTVSRETNATESLG